MTETVACPQLADRLVEEGWNWSRKPSSGHRPPPHRRAGIRLDVAHQFFLPAVSPGTASSVLLTGRASRMCIYTAGVDCR
jgi:hypothetical protein